MKARLTVIIATGLAVLLAGIVPWVRPDGFVFAALAPLVILLGSNAGLVRRVLLAAVASVTVAAVQDLQQRLPLGNLGARVDLEGDDRTHDAA